MARRSFIQFRNLPSDILHLIFERTSTDALHAFAHVNKQYNTIVTPFLYLTVTIPSLDRLLSFDRTLAQKPELAAHVRHLLVSDRLKVDYDAFSDVVGGAA